MGVWEYGSMGVWEYGIIGAKFINNIMENQLFIVLLSFLLFNF